MSYDELDGVVKGFSVSFDRIPFTDGEGGESVCINYDSGKSCQKEQIICYSPEFEDYHLGYTFADLIGEYVAGIKGEDIFMMKSLVLL